MYLRVKYNKWESSQNYNDVMKYDCIITIIVFRLHSFFIELNSKIKI